METRRRQEGYKRETRLIQELGQAGDKKETRRIQRGRQA